MVKPTGHVVDSKIHEYVSDVGAKPLEGNVRDTKGADEACQQYVVVYGVKCGTQIQESENGYLSLVSVFKKAISNMEKNSFITMMMALSGLLLFKAIVCDMLNQIMETDPLKMFCKVMQVSK